MEQQATGEREDLCERIVPHLRSWARHNIHFGLSPQAREAWNGMLKEQSPEDWFQTTLVNVGRASETAFTALRKARERLPRDTGLTAVVTGGCMLYRFPCGEPERGGELNGHFLDPGVMAEQVFPLIRMLGPCVRVVLLRIAPVYRTERYPLETFLGKLARCLEGLPPSYRYAVEIGNPEYLQPEYFACLRERDAAHMLRDHLPSPSVLDQLQMPHALTGDIVLLRGCPEEEETDLLLRSEARAPAADASLAVIETVRCCLGEKKTLYAYVDGTPGSFAALLAALDGDLAKLSPIRMRAA